LLCHALGWRRTELITRSDRPLAPEQVGTCELLIARRFAGEPVAQLVGTREFFGRDFLVTPAVLIPRPDTELLVELALEAIDAHSGTQTVLSKALDPAHVLLATARSNAAQASVVSVLDLGTGSGAIAVTLAAERPMIAVLATDRSKEALLVAERNAITILGGKHASPARTGGPSLPAGQRIAFVQGDWFAALHALDQKDRTERFGDAELRFDVVVSNPPYIAAHDPHLLSGDLRFEPAGALTDGGDGLSDLRHIAHGAGVWLKPGGRLLLEHGYDQGLAVREILEAAGFTAIQTVCDLAEHERVTLGVWPA
jgi:release factor glutamine methyltransferase